MDFRCKTARVNFRSLYQHGFARVAACTGRIAIADPPANAESVLRQARECSAEGVAVAVFPELNLTGYSIEDLLLQDAVLDRVQRRRVRLPALDQGDERPLEEQAPRLPRPLFHGRP